MEILFDSASIRRAQNPSQLSPQLLLCAPPPLKLLAAPQIAGLLPATVPTRVKIFVDKHPNLAIEALIDSIPTIEELDARLADILVRHYEQCSTRIPRRSRYGGAA